MKNQKISRGARQALWFGMWWNFYLKGPQLVQTITHTSRILVYSWCWLTSTVAFAFFFNNDCRVPDIGVLPLFAAAFHQTFLFIVNFCGVGINLSNKLKSSIHFCCFAFVYCPNDAIRANEVWNDFWHIF